jgi:hypothetical protein
MHISYIYQTSHASCAKIKTSKNSNIRNQITCEGIEPLV